MCRCARADRRSNGPRRSRAPRPRLSRSSARANRSPQPSFQPRATPDRRRGPAQKAGPDLGMNAAQALYRANPSRKESNAVPHATTPEPVRRNAPEPIRTLRDWLDHLEKHDRLAVIRPRARLQHDVAAIAKRLDGQKATLFPQPDGHAIPVISGLISDRRWMAEAMGVEPHEVLTRFQEAALNPIAWQEVKDAPAQEVVETDVDLSHLPIPVHNEHDKGAYITAGLLIARNPRTGVQNVSIHRLQVSGR